MPDKREDATVIGLIGYFGGGSLGNEMTLRAARDALRRLVPTARLICIGEVPARVEVEQELECYSLRMASRYGTRLPRSRLIRLLVRPVIEVVRWMKTIKLLRGVDVLVVPGTGILDDFSARPWQMPYDIFRWSLASRVAHTKLCFVSVGAGPIHNRVSRFLLSRAAGFADHCSYRDQASKRYMTSIGRNTENDQVFPDLAFSLSRPEPQFRDVTPDAVTVGIGVMTYYGWENRPDRGAQVYQRYIEQIVEVCVSRLDAGYHLRVLIGDLADETAVSDVERILRERLSDHVVDERVTIPSITTFHDLLVEIIKVDVLITSRFHNVVFGLMMQLPVLSLGYTTKNLELLESVGLGAYSQGIEGFDPEQLERQFNDLVGHRKEIWETLRLMNVRNAEALEVQYRQVLELVGVSVSISDAA